METTNNKNIVLTSVAWSVVASIAVSVLMQGFLFSDQDFKFSQVAKEKADSSVPAKPPVVSGEAVKKEIINASYVIQGPVKEIGVNFFVVEANVVDVANLDNVGPVKEGVPLPVITKKYRVNVNAATNFGDKTLSDISTESVVAVESVEGVYTQDTLTAKRVTIQK